MHHGALGPFRPGVPGIAKNARAVAALMPDDATTDAVLAGNAQQIYRL